MPAGKKDLNAPARVLIVADADAATPAVLGAVRERVRRGRAEFRVLVPNPAPAEWHPFAPERRDKVEDAERRLMRSLPRIQDAVDAAVRGRVSSRHDPMAAVEELLHEEPFDEVIVALAPHRLERRLHADLAHRLAHLGLPVTTAL
jgi:hypothetical protein